MIISDLSYLEVVAEASSVVGGTVIKTIKKPTVPQINFVLPVIVVPVTTTTQNNSANINQNANSQSAAVTEHGDANSSANAENNLSFNQANVTSP